MHKKYFTPESEIFTSRHDHLSTVVLYLHGYHCQFYDVLSYQTIHWMMNAKRNEQIIPQFFWRIKKTPIFSATLFFSVIFHSNLASGIPNQNIYFLGAGVSTHNHCCIIIRAVVVCSYFSGSSYFCKNVV